MYPDPPAVEENDVAIVEPSAIGVGASAEVYKAKYKNNLVALKKRRRGEYTITFHSEINIMKSCPSPYIIGLLGVVSEESINPKMILTLMDKGSLKENINNLQISAYEVLKVVAHALEDLHQCGIMHRDINPKNIFLCSTNYIKVGDLGISRDYNALMTLGVGTLIYMAPEVLKSEGSYDYAADIYSLGAVLFEMVTAQTPFAGKNVMPIIRGVSSGELRLTLPKGNTHWLDALATACLQYNPQDRPSAKQVVEFLHKIPQNAQSDKFSQFIVPQDTLNLLIPK
ncbi:kinase [Thraustotheca clavata]|uniref:Kinase n=1 Tax=Thraustotheca clavata TaxID=74557 RepID=A0A1V9Y8X2_9STRA|nr:kinase [Thraustotheca clavata]